MKTLVFLVILLAGLPKIQSGKTIYVQGRTSDLVEKGYKENAEYTKKVAIGTYILTIRGKNRLENKKVVRTRENYDGVNEGFSVHEMIQCDAYGYFNRKDQNPFPNPLKVYPKTMKTDKWKDEMYYLVFFVDDKKMEPGVDLVGRTIVGPGEYYLQKKYSRITNKNGDEIEPEDIIEVQA